MIPVGFEECDCKRFDGPPRVIAAGFQLAEGKLIGPQDMFKDIAFNNARQQGMDIADALRRLGPFEPHRLPLEEMEYTTMPQVMNKLKGRFQDLY
jgi:fructose 1,6-bisphosphate aldolase/phosphatase